MQLITCETEDELYDEIIKCAEDTIFEIHVIENNCDDKKVKRVFGCGFITSKQLREIEERYDVKFIE